MMTMEKEHLKRLQFSLSLNETQSLMTSMNEQSKNSLTLVYVMVAVSVLIAAVALFYTLRK
jgi:hypothetical protein